MESRKNLYVWLSQRHHQLSKEVIHFGQRYQRFLFARFSREEKRALPFCSPALSPLKRTCLACSRFFPGKITRFDVISKRKSFSLSSYYYFLSARIKLGEDSRDRYAKLINLKREEKSLFSSNIFENSQQISITVIISEESLNFSSN